MSKDINMDETEKTRVALGREKQKKKKIWVSIMVFILSIGVWTAVVYYGYTYAKGYMDDSIKHIQQQNAFNIQQLTERIDLLSKEVGGLRSAIENTDSSLSYSAKVQNRIDAKLKDLDKQLAELEKSLQILKEAP